MAGTFILPLPSILVLSSLIPFFDCHVIDAQPPPVAAGPMAATSCSEDNPLFSQIEDLKLKVSQLETTLEETNKQITAKILYADKCEKRLEELTNKTNEFETFLPSLKSAPVDKKKIIALEEEVRSLWDASRKNNFLLHMLESKLVVAEEQMESLTLQAEKMSGIVTELWIQIQQLEQVLQITKMRVAELQWRRRYARCIFFKVVYVISRDISSVMHWFDPYLPGEGSFRDSLMSAVRKKLEWFFGAMKKHHHQLQGYVRREMKRYEFTVPLTNDEVVFFVASVLILLPFMGAWCWISTIWSS